MMDLNIFYNSPNYLTQYYRDFQVTERILLTGHSHQAWPDAALEGMLTYWKDAADNVDYKWGKAFEKADEVRKGFAGLMKDETGLFALASNTHDLLLKFLSALDWKKRNKIITTDMEFHTVRRQLDRLSEEGIEIVRVSAYPPETVAERIENLVDDKTACVIVSKVFYKNGRIIENLGNVEKKCLQTGAQLLVDIYHALNVLPIALAEEGLTNSFLVGGGYKYCQLGEGNCFLRFPADCQLRPVFTGWFSEFNKLAEVKKAGDVPYGEGNFRFAGSTYDPVSNYRAAAVFNFFKEQNLTPEILREINLHQIKLMAEKFDSNDFNPQIISRDYETPLNKSGGFLVLKSAYAGVISEKLYEKGIFTDYREDHLRIGPAPYLSDNQLCTAMDELSEIIKSQKVSE